MVIDPAGFQACLMRRLTLATFGAMTSLSCGQEPVELQTQMIPDGDTVGGVSVRASVVTRPDSGVSFEVTFENPTDEPRTLELSGCPVRTEAYETEPTVQAQPEWTDIELIGCPGLLEMLEFAPGQTHTIRHPVIGTGATREHHPDGLKAGEYYLVAIVRAGEPEREFRVLASPAPIRIP